VLKQFLDEVEDIRAAPRESAYLVGLKEILRREMSSWRKDVLKENTGSLFGKTALRLFPNVPATLKVCCRVTSESGSGSRALHLRSFRQCSLASKLAVWGTACDILIYLVFSLKPGLQIHELSESK